MTLKTQDCTACARRIAHPNPTQPFHQWMCAWAGFAVGDRVMNCTHWKRRDA